MGGHYIGANILLHRGDEMIIGHEVAHSHDANGMVMGRANSNPILNTRKYQVEFAWCKVTELTTNIIPESIYTQYNANGNEYLIIIRITV